MLLTDGAPNCNLEASCAADQCTLNIEGAKVGISANQGLFGHGSGVILTR